MDRARTRIKSLVEQSSVLSPEEKAYWLEHLPTMSRDQCSRLVEILTAPDTMPFEAELTQYFAALNRAATAALSQGPAAFAAA